MGELSLALDWAVRENWPQRCEHGSPGPAPHQDKVGKLAPETWAQESWWDDQLSYHTGLDPELSAGLSQHLWTAGMHEGAGPEEPKLLHDTGQQQDIREESQWGSGIDSIAEARGLEPGQWQVKLFRQRGIYYMTHCDTQRGIYYMTHCDTQRGIYYTTRCDTLQFPQQDFIYLYFLSWRRLQGQRKDMVRWMRLGYMVWNSQRINKKNLNKIA